ncbi:type IV pilin biogenesis protein PilC [Vibrio ichthyoenteri ATCC 700023]|uniref:Type IV pilin biogenesis protein PilC n=1 Tax=Vibrio ichthyoenteri ATCC 700023 TaxID=870968 RepID=F9S453_9VIBR|nr:type II secretion system F family protein [Vibrio ichthyoenteri]EGU37269.1 type IV pilin biogenesis protein PilC [Vibrio ichthyoenteri ATCC 700023]
MRHKEKSVLKVYRWKGTNALGRPISGKCLAVNQSEVRERLKLQKVRIQKLTSYKISWLKRQLESVKPKDITVLTRQLATILATGIPLVQALKLVNDNNKKSEMVSLLHSVTKKIESGLPLSQALASSRHFDALYIDLITTGEETGRLDQVFTRIANYREKSERLKAKVIKAMIYPSMVLLTALVVSWVILTMVIPEFEDMFQSFGAELPGFTQRVLSLSSYAREHGIALFLCPIVALLLTKLGCKYYYPYRFQLSRLSLRLPLIGSVVSKAAIAKFSRTMATSIAAGIPILAGLKSAAKTTNHCYYQAAISRVYKETAAGMPLYVAMRHSNTFPEMPLQMIMIGEETGRLDEMLHKIATLYETEIDETVDNLGKIIEPAIIIFLSLIVGSLVIAIYLPVFNLMNVIG